MLIVFMLFGFAATVKTVPDIYIFFPPESWIIFSGTRRA